MRGEVREFAPGTVARRVPPREPERPVDAETDLVRDEGEHERLQDAGHERAGTYAYSRATDTFLEQCRAGTVPKG